MTMNRRIARELQGKEDGVITFDLLERNLLNFIQRLIPILISVDIIFIIFNTSYYIRKISRIFYDAIERFSER